MDSSQEIPRPKRPMDEPHLRKLGLFVIVSTLLFVTFLLTVANPNILAKEGIVLFGSILGGVVFTFFLMFSREVKHFKQKLEA